jgi:hypothetical protein
VRKSTGIGVFIAVMTIAVMVPPVLAHALGQPALAGAVVLPVMATLLPALLADIRTALFAAAVLSVGSAAAAAVTGDALLSGLVMAGTALTSGLACRWGRSRNLIFVPITVGFVICLPPTGISDGSINAAILGAVSLAAGLWGTAVGWYLGRKTTKPPHPLETWSRTWVYAIVLAILTGIAAGISVAADWKHAGAWFILTVAIVFQPYIQDAFRRTWQRAAGTVIGVISAFAIHFVIPWSTAELILGLALMVTAMVVSMNSKYPYWFFTSLLTPAIVLLAGSSSNFDDIAAARLVATFAGAGLALAAVLLLAPLYSASAKRKGLTHY